tara:strand:- start:1858 stop:2097 length:240 start_codon:yes stop_codon:yes gene_type:complete
VALKPLKASKYLIVGLWFPYGLLYLILALTFWFYLTPNKERMFTLNFSWILPIWLRNVLLLFAVAGCSSASIELKVMKQ